MFRKLIIHTLIIALLVGNCSRFFVYAGFELNQSYITEHFCINKSKPAMHCNGHCYLMKKLAQANDKEKKQDRESQKNRYQEALPHLPQSLVFYPKHITICYCAYLEAKPCFSNQSVFHPPQYA